MNSLVSNLNRDLDDHVRDGRLTPELLAKLMEHPEVVHTTYWREKKLLTLPGRAVVNSINHAFMIRDEVVYAGMADRKTKHDQRNVPSIWRDTNLAQDFEMAAYDKHSRSHWSRFAAFAKNADGYRYGISVKRGTLNDGLITEYGEIETGKPVHRMSYTKDGWLYAILSGSGTHDVVHHGQKYYKGFSRLSCLTADGHDCVVTASGVIQVNSKVVASCQTDGVQFAYGHMADGKLAYAREASHHTVLYWNGSPISKVDLKLDGFKMVGGLPLIRCNGVFHGEKRLSGKSLSTRDPDEDMQALWDARGTALFLTGKKATSEEHGTLRIHHVYDRSPAYDDVFEPEITEHEVRVVARRGRDLFLLTHPL